jgi:hypothetical protein
VDLHLLPGRSLRSESENLQQPQQFSGAIAGRSRRAKNRRTFSRTSDFRSLLSREVKLPIAKEFFG